MPHYVIVSRRGAEKEDKEFTPRGTFLGEVQAVSASDALIAFARNFLEDAAVRPFDSGKALCEHLEDVIGENIAAYRVAETVDGQPDKESIPEMEFA